MEDRRDPHADFSGRRILIVDDAEGMRDLLTMFLEGTGCEVETAADGAEAMVALSERRPDAMLLDLRMPHVTGVELLRAIDAVPSLAQLPVEIMAELGARHGIPPSIEKREPLQPLAIQRANCALVTIPRHRHDCATLGRDYERGCLL